MGVRGLVPFTNLPLASSDPGDAYCPCGMWLASSASSAAETQDCCARPTGLALVGNVRSRVPCPVRQRQEMIWCSSPLGGDVLCLALPIVSWHV